MNGLTLFQAALVGAGVPLLVAVLSFVMSFFHDDLKLFLRIIAGVMIAITLYGLIDYLIH